MASLSHAKPLMLPVAMIGGALFAPWMENVAFLSPYLIFMMLFITYCKLDFRDFKPSKFEVILLCIQMLLAVSAYLLLFKVNRILAEGVFICFFIPTATAAPVITSMLGGSISKVATFSLISNIFIAFVGPLALATVGEHPEMTFLQSFLIILQKVMPLLIGPIAAALLIRYSLPKVHRVFISHQQLSFYLWAVSLFIVVGGCVSFVINNWSSDKAWIICLLAVGALAACLIQFKAGRAIGGHFGDKVSGGQGLGQKNTVLAVWLAMVYLNPLSSIAPAAYIAWQNIINSAQLIRKERLEADAEALSLKSKD